MQPVGYYRSIAILRGGVKIFLDSLDGHNQPLAVRPECQTLPARVDGQAFSRHPFRHVWLVLGYQSQNLIDEPL